MGPSPTASELDARLAQLRRDHHRHLLSLAFRVVGSLSEAEHIVQEGFTRLVHDGLVTHADVVLDPIRIADLDVVLNT